MSIYVHYGQSRPKDAKILAQSDVVLTTYGVVASEFSSEVTVEFQFTLFPANDSTGAVMQFYKRFERVYICCRMLKSVVDFIL